MFKPKSFRGPRGTLILIALGLLLAAGAFAVVYHPPYKAPLDTEPANGRPIECHIATSGTADISIPLATTPCYGYLQKVRISSTSGTAAADTTAALHWEFYVLKGDSNGTATADTVASYTTQSATAAYTMSTLKSYKMTMATTLSKMAVKPHEVIVLRCESVGTTPTAVTNLQVSFIFQPTDTRYKNP